MKSLPIASLALVLALTGCASSQTDPLDEINKVDDFRVCVKTWLEDRGYNLVENDLFHIQAKIACAFLLD
jgi:hypothetical protein